MSEPDTLVCGDPDNKGLTGTIVAQCADCGKDVGIAPSGQKLLATGKFGRIVCVRCAFTQKEEDDPPDPQLRLLQAARLQRRNRPLPPRRLPALAGDPG